MLCGRTHNAYLCVGRLHPALRLVPPVELGDPVGREAQRQLEEPRLVLERHEKVHRVGEVCPQLVDRGDVEVVVVVV